MFTKEHTFWLVYLLLLWSSTHYPLYQVELQYRCLVTDCIPSAAMWFMASSMREKKTTQAHHCLDIVWVSHITLREGTDWYECIRWTNCATHSLTVCHAINFQEVVYLDLIELPHYQTLKTARDALCTILKNVCVICETCLSSAERMTSKQCGDVLSWLSRYLKTKEETENQTK